MSAFEFVILVVAILFSLNWVIYIRKNVRTGIGITQQTVNTTMLFVVSIFVVLIWKLSTLNLFWMFPVGWFLGSGSLLFPLSLFNIPGKWFGNLFCFGLDPEEIKQNTKRLELVRIYVNQGMSIQEALKKTNEKGNESPEAYRKLLNQNPVDADINWILVEDGPRGDYYLSSTQVTINQYDKFCSFTGKEKPYIHWVRNGNLPVVNVTISDAEEFCKWLSQQIGQTVRLPEEDEWEYGAQGGKKSKGYIYSGSNNIEEVAWYIHNSDYKTHLVATKKPNELGIYDMSGNVFEWCGSKGAVRGGSWAFYENLCRIEARINFIDIQKMDLHYLGFRILKEK